MLNNLLPGLITYLVEAFQLLFFFRKSFAYRNKHILARICLFLVLFAIPFLTMRHTMNAWWNIPLSLLCDLLLVHCIYHGSRAKKLAQVFVYYLILLVSDILALLIINFPYEQSRVFYLTGPDEILAQFLARLFSMAIILLCANYPRMKMNTRLERLIYLAVHICACFVILLTEFMRVWRAGGRENDFLVFYAAVCTLLLVLYLTDRLLLLEKTERMEFEHRLETEGQRRQIAHYETGLRSLRHILHDTKAHQLYLIGALQDNLVQPALRYLQNWYGKLVKAAPRVITGNVVVDILLREYAVVCEKGGIHLIIQGKLPVELSIRTADLVSLVGNLLENAVKACGELEPEDRRIYFTVHYNWVGCLTIKVENTYRKDRREREGHGLEIVGEIAEGYEGRVLVRKEGLFMVAVSLMED